jgi:hypothetical protein
MSKAKKRHSSASANAQDRMNRANERESADNQNRNQSNNAKKEALGPNTDR